MIKFAVTRRFEGYGCLVVMSCHLGMCSFGDLSAIGEAKIWVCFEIVYLAESFVEKI